MAKVAKKPSRKCAASSQMKRATQAIDESPPAIPVENAEEMIVCRSAARRVEPVLLEKWRYDLLRQAILNVVPADDIGLMYKQLTPAVRANLSPADRARIGPLHHDATLVKFDLEFGGELEQIAGMRPQYLRRVRPSLKAFLQEETT
jgi:hypothetical protein